MRKVNVLLNFVEEFIIKRFAFIGIMSAFILMVKIFIYILLPIPSEKLLVKN
jgi:hypothetical protein